ncbi:unnamed protein product [Blepharisma stoltei]|uniref:Uncharacterized protein n=1 Tax=Blepharisma stoltei TaxID=1481888 RepID=A0AAU9KAE5_9CILI|nr:unnamed protein product [Blepharisma stoltei]
MIKHNWTFILETLVESRCEIKLFIVDTVIFDIMDVFKPVIWIFTNRKGKLDYRNLNNLTISDISKAFLEVLNFQGLGIRGSEWFEPGKAVLIKHDGLRLIIDDIQVEDLPHSYPDDIHTLQLYQFHKAIFDKYIYTYEFSIDEPEADENFHRKLVGSHNEENTMICWDEIIKKNIKRTSRLIFKNFEQLSSLKIVGITLMYYIEHESKQPWFCGAENCTFRKKSDAKRFDSFSFISNKPLYNNTRKITQGHSITSLKINNRQKSLLSQSFLSRKKKINDSFYIRHAHEKSFMRITPILRSPDISVVIEPPKSRAFSRQSRSRNPSSISQSRKSMDAHSKLPSFSNAEEFTIPFKRRPTFHNTQCKIYIQSDKLKIFPSDEHYSCKCVGDFCNLTNIQLPMHDKSLRFLVPKQSLMLGRMSSYSPIRLPEFRLVPPDILLACSKFKPPEKLIPKLQSASIFKPIHNSESINTIAPRLDEESVCLKCFVVYYNIMSSFQFN